MKKKFISPLEDSTQTVRHQKRSKDAFRGINAEGSTYLALYYNRPATANVNTPGAEMVGFDGLKELGFNVLAEVTRGGKSQIVQPLQPRISPVGGDWELLRACEGASQAVDGVFDACDFTDIAGACVVKGALCGEGECLVEVDPITKDFTVVGLNPLETFFNNDRTEVTTLRVISRRRLRAQHGKKVTKDGRSMREVIDELPNYDPETIIEVDSAGQWDAEDSVALYSFWAEAIGDEEGKFVHQFDDKAQTILDEGEWKHPLPVGYFEWDEGFRGANDARPMARSVAPMHFWLNEMVRKMNDALAGSKPIVSGSKDPKLSDVPYEFIKDEDGTLKVWTPNVVSADVRQAITDLREQSHREVGQSEEAAAGSAPPQFKSGVALSTWRQIVNTAISQQLRNYDRLWNMVARILLSMMSEVYKSKPARAAARGTEVIEQIDFAKLNLPENSWIINFDVVSDLPKHIPQKLELLDYLETKGWIDGPTALVNLNLVDFKAVAKRAAGPRSLMELQISRALNEAELIPPSEMQDAAKLAELVSQAYQAAKAQRIQPPAQNMQALLHLYLLAKARMPTPGAGPTMLPAPASPPVPQLEGEAALPAETGVAAPTVPAAEPLPT